MIVSAPAVHPRQPSCTHDAGGILVVAGSSRTLVTTASVLSFSIGVGGPRLLPAQFDAVCWAAEFQAARWPVFVNNVILKACALSTGGVWGSAGRSFQLRGASWISRLPRRSEAFGGGTSDCSQFWAEHISGARISVLFIFIRSSCPSRPQPLRAQSAPTYSPAAALTANE